VFALVLAICDQLVESRLRSTAKAVSLEALSVQARPIAFVVVAVPERLEGAEGGVSSVVADALELQAV
jgi:hypothetical protein